MEERLRDMEGKMNQLSGTELETLLDSYHKLSHEFEQLNGYAYRSEVVGILKGLGVIILNVLLPLLLSLTGFIIISTNAINIFKDITAVYVLVK